MGERTKDERTERFELRLTKEELEGLRATSTYLGMSAADYIRLLLHTTDGTDIMRRNAMGVGKKKA